MAVCRILATERSGRCFAPQPAWVGPLAAVPRGVSTFGAAPGPDAGPGPNTIGGRFGKRAGSKHFAVRAERGPPMVHVAA